jgi:hypothetical protein
MIPYARQKTWVDNTGQQVDSAWLNNVEDSLVSALGVAPATNGALVWDGTKFRADSLIKNANIDAAAAIDYSKLNVPAGAIPRGALGALGIVNADVAAAAALAGSKLDLTPTVGLPVANLTNGQVNVYTDSLAAPTFMWLMVYVSALTRWYYLGGSPAHISIITAETTANTAFVDLATVGPQFQVPIAGLYEVEVMSGHIQNSGTDDFRIGISVGGGAATEIAWSNAAANASNGQSMGGMARFATTSNQVIKMQYRTRAGGTHTAYNRELKVTPVYFQA